MKSATAKRRGSGTLVWILTGFVGAFAAWAYNAPLDEIVRGPGVLVPASSAQVVQSLEGGILDEIKVSEGDVVQKGQLLARLNETRYLAEVQDFQSQILATEAKLLRLQAELDRISDFSLPAEMHAQDADLAQSEEQLFAARMMQFDAELNSANEELALREEKVALMKNLVEQNALPAIDLLNAEVAASETRSSRDTILSAYALDRSDEMSQLVADLARLQAQIEQSKDQLERSNLVSPTDGIINTIYTTTVGGVIQPGAEIFEITPLNDKLLVEVRIQPKDIAFIAADMRSTVKLSAYDYTVYGSLGGYIAQVSADTFDENLGPQEEPYYKVLVALDAEKLEAKGQEYEIRPGMLADAEVHVGQKTVMQYLVTPLIKSQQAMREP